MTVEIDKDGQIVDKAAVIAKARRLALQHANRAESAYTTLMQANELRMTAQLRQALEHEMALMWATVGGML